MMRKECVANIEDGVDWKKEGAENGERNKRYE